MTRTLPLLFIIIFSQQALAAGASGFFGSPDKRISPEKRAIKYFNQGIEYRNEAWEWEEKAASLEGEKQAKALKKAKKKYKSAEKRYKKAIKNNSALHEAHGSLGYVLRKQGRYESALQAYDKALALKPDYGEALEYRGEAYLALGRLEEAQQALADLVTIQDFKHARELLKAMDSWVQNGGIPQVSLADTNAFGLWVNLRKVESSAWSRDFKAAW